jgi:hypothetical protein
MLLGVFDIFLLLFYSISSLCNTIFEQRQDMQAFLFKDITPTNLFVCQLRYNVALLKKDFLLGAWQTTKKTLMKVNERGKWARLNYDTGKLKDHGTLLGITNEKAVAAIPTVC